LLLRVNALHNHLDTYIDLMSVKRDLISVKGDLISVKRDLMSVKGDLISALMPCIITWIHIYIHTHTHTQTHTRTHTHTHTHAHTHALHDHLDTPGGLDLAGIFVVTCADQTSVKRDLL